MDNAVFEYEPEVTAANLLLRVSQQVKNGEQARKVIDVNGNIIGQFEITNK